MASPSAATRLEYEKAAEIATAATGWQLVRFVPDTASAVWHAATDHLTGTHGDYGDRDVFSAAWNVRYTDEPFDQIMLSWCNMDKWAVLSKSKLWGFDGVEHNTEGANFHILMNSDNPSYNTENSGWGLDRSDQNAYGKLKDPLFALDTARNNWRSMLYSGNSNSYDDRTFVGNGGSCVYVRDSTATAFELINLARACGTNADEACPTAASSDPANHLDDINDGVFNNGFHTNSELNPWWRVDFGATRSVQSVNIWNRFDCCRARLSQFEIYVGDSASSFAANTRCHADAGTITDASAQEIVVQCVGTGRYLFVVLPKTEHLQLAEVQVMGLSS